MKYLVPFNGPGILVCIGVKGHAESKSGRIFELSSLLHFHFGLFINSQYNFKTKVQKL